MAVDSQWDSKPTWGPSTTINDAVDRWRTNGWEDLSPKTARGYQEIWRCYIRDGIGTERIADLSAYDVERFFRALKAEGAGRDTVRRVKTVLHRACRLAERWSAGVLRNPVAGTELPIWALHERRDPVRAPTVAEVRRLLSAARRRDQRVAVFIRVLAACGMRRAEACALRWSDIDFDTGTISIDKAVVAAVGGAVVKGPKTRASIRLVAVDGTTLAALEALRSSDGGQDSSTTDQDFIFSGAGGHRPPHPDSMSHVFMKVRAEAGVAPDIHLHSLRHFHATVLDPVVSDAQKQARMGWSSPTMARRYTDAIPDEDRRAAEHVAQLLDP